MLSVLQVFKLIFGLIAAGIIFFFLINYAGSYSTVQSNTLKAKTMVSFLQTVSDVYTTGNPYYFDGFEDLEFRFSLDTTTLPLSLRHDAGNLVVFTPLFTYPGDSHVIERTEMEYGWWDFYFVRAVPAMNVYVSIENPTDPKAIVIARETIEMFPDSLSFDTTPILFGFCNGGQKTTLKDCGSTGNLQCHRGRFVNKISNPRPGMAQCSSVPQNEMNRLIRIGTCTSAPAQGICVNPTTEKVYIEGNSTGFDYRDALEVFVLSLGGATEDEFGVREAEKLYHYKRDVFKENVQLAAKMGKIRYDLLKTRSPSPSCTAHYDNLITILSDLSQDTTVEDPILMGNQLEQSAQIHLAMYLDGCDYT
ncbi:MAG: hypothetical protein ABIJ92_02835 [Candidatus Aenigmatarchaeota archaeon]